MYFNAWHFNQRLVDHPRSFLGMAKLKAAVRRFKRYWEESGNINRLTDRDLRDLPMIRDEIRREISRSIWYP